MELRDYIDKTISILLVDQKTFYAVKLIGVEAGGLWIESQDLKIAILRNAGSSSWSNPVFFVPFARINVVAATPDSSSPLQ